MVNNKKKRPQKVIRNWFDINPPRVQNVGFFMKPAQRPVFRIAAPIFMDKSPSFSALWVPQRIESNKWLPMVQTPRRPVSYFWGDKDRDGIYNGLDCEPFNPFKQGENHEPKEKPRDQKARLRREAKKYPKHAPARPKSDEELAQLLNKRTVFPGTYILRKVKGIQPDPDLKVGKLAKPFHPHRYEGGKLKRDMGEVYITEPSMQFIKDQEKAKMEAYEKEAIWEQLKEFGVPGRKGVVLNPKHKKDFYNDDRVEKIKDIMRKEKIYKRGIDAFQQKEKENERIHNLRIYGEDRYKKKMNDELERTILAEIPKMRKESRQEERSKKKEFYDNLKMGDTSRYTSNTEKLPKKKHLKFAVARMINSMKEKPIPTPYIPVQTIDQLSKEEIMNLGSKGEEIKIRLRKERTPKEKSLIDVNDEVEDKDYVENDVAEDKEYTEDTSTRIEKPEKVAKEEKEEEEYDLSKVKYDDDENLEEDEDA